MATVPPGPQFIQMSPLDQSTLSGLANKDKTQYLRVTKMAIRQYLQECLDEGGQFRHFFDKLAPSTIGYHVNQNLPEDLNERALQIAVYYANMTERPPMMFIQDNGYDYTPDSLGSLAAGWNMQTRDGEQIVRVMDVVKIPINITCATTSQQDLEDLIAATAVAFGQLQRFTTGYILRPKTMQSGVYWEVRIPLPHSVSPKVHTPIHGDPQMQIWQATCSMTVDFENSVYLQYRAQPQHSPQQGELTLTIPSVLRLKQEQRISLQNRTDPILVYSNDARIAIVRQIGREWIIVPRRVGTFTLIVSRTIGSQEGPEILAQQEIEIRAR